MDLQQLAAIFQATLASDRATIKGAEEQLKAISKSPGYTLQVLKLIATPGLDASVCLSAAVNFKNIVKYRWVPTDADIYGGLDPIPDNEKTGIKEILPDLVISAVPLVQAQLNEALTLICACDFPLKWPNLLRELAAKLGAAAATHAFPSIVVILRMASGIFQRYRGQSSSNNKLVAELDHSQQDFLPVLLEASRRLSAALPTVQDAGDVASLRNIICSYDLSFQIFHSLSFMGITPLMEEQLPWWMSQLLAILNFNSPLLAESDPDRASVLDAALGSACEAADFFVQQLEEELEPYLGGLATSVWHVLMRVSLNAGQDALAIAAMNFLTSISQSVYYSMFKGDVLRTICESVVIPNLRLRPEDEECFELNHTEFIRRFAQGGDASTRRRSAADLVRSLVERFAAEVAPLFTELVQKELAAFQADPRENWRAKDTAVFVVLALSARGRTEERGATKVAAVVDLDVFFQTQILPELQAPDVNGFPLLKADAIQFLTVFRSVLPKPVLLSALPHLVRLLACPANVVHSYAAIAIERLLALREVGGMSGMPTTGKRAKFEVSDIAPILQPMLSSLFTAFRHPDSSENEFLMKAVMRVVGSAGSEIAPLLPLCLQALAGILIDVCRNPKNPGFNHYLFETVAALIRNGAEANRLGGSGKASSSLSNSSNLSNNLSSISNGSSSSSSNLANINAAASGTTPAPSSSSLSSATATNNSSSNSNSNNSSNNNTLFVSTAVAEQYERHIFSAFEYVLQQDVQEFHPYVFQIFAMLIEIRDPAVPLPAAYLQIFPPLMMPVFWERSGNVPALSRLVQAFLWKAAAAVVAGGHLLQVLGIFQKLASSKAHDHEGFALLNALVAHAPLAAYKPHLPTIFHIFNARLARSRTPKFARGVALFSLFLAAKHGAAELQAAVEEPTVGMGGSGSGLGGSGGGGGALFGLVRNVIVPYMPYIEGREEGKAIIVGAVRLLTEWLAAPPNRHIAGSRELYRMLGTAAQKKLEAGADAVDSDEDGVGGGGGFTVAGMEEAGGDGEEFEESASGYTVSYARLANACRPDPILLTEVADAAQVFHAAVVGVVEPDA